MKFNCIQSIILLAAYCVSDTEDNSHINKTPALQLLIF